MTQSSRPLDASSLPSEHALDAPLTSSAQTSAVVANGLAHHVLRWGAWEGEVAASPPVVLCHGFQDVAYSYELVARELVNRGRSVLAFEWRGHGRTDAVGAGGYYYFADYVRDLHTLTRALGLGAAMPYDLVGHSMGGTACAMFAGTRPQGLRALALIEGSGPPSDADLATDEGRARDATLAADRLVDWLRTVDRVLDKPARPLRDRDEALTRLRVMHPDLDGPLGRFIAEHSVVEREHGLAFAFDPLHRTRAPYPFRRDTFVELLRRVDVPTLVVTGTVGWRAPDHTERVAALRDRTDLELEGGHMLHWHRPRALGTALARFFAA